MLLDLYLETHYLMEPNFEILLMLRTMVTKKITYKNIDESHRKLEIWSGQFGLVIWSICLLSR